MERKGIREIKERRDKGGERERKRDWREIEREREKERGWIFELEINNLIRVSAPAVARSKHGRQTS
jgi:hypothetical protein